KRDKVELIEGKIVEKMPTDPPHVLTLELVYELLRGACQPGWIIRTEAPLQLEQSEPEPDAMIIRGPREQYAGRHPNPDDVLLVIEVSDSTLRDDRNEMARLYAEGRIPFYWIVNLKDRWLEVHSEPSGPGAAPAYTQKKVIAEDGTAILSFPDGMTAKLPVKGMFPTKSSE
ncbi:MAG TPA: Uma2 family endonuclease, partial [Phycisphaerae bacterium]|nr:Uma2 family endonuclease [Phycisphaerae bacterium]